MIFGIDFAANNIEKLMQFENNCMGATLSSVAAIYNCIITITINAWVMHYIASNVLPYNDAL